MGAFPKYPVRSTGPAHRITRSFVPGARRALSFARASARLAPLRRRPRPVASPPSFFRCFVIQGAAALVRPPGWRRPFKVAAYAACISRSFRPGWLEHGRHQSEISFEGKRGKRLKMNLKRFRSCWRCLPGCSVFADKRLQDGGNLLLLASRKPRGGIE